MIDFVLLISRQGKLRLSKWYSVRESKERARTVREVSALVLGRVPKMANVIEYKDQKLVYKRYASLFFVMGIGKYYTALMTLEMIHQYVEVLYNYVGNVCELDIIFNFHKAYYILDELFIGGELQETNKREVMRVVVAHEALARQESELTAGLFE